MFFRLLQVTIKIVTKSLESKPSSLLISTNNLGMASVALPDGINTKKIWKAEHQKKTVAVFQYLSILDASGNTHIYPAGDYVAVGADRIALK